MKLPVYNLDDRRKRVYYTYLLRLGNGKYYVGQTANLKKRFSEHRKNEGSRITKRNPPREISHYETFLTRDDATQRELELKRLSNREKNIFLTHKKGAENMLKRKKRAAAKKRRSPKKRVARKRRNAPIRRKRAVSRKRRRNPKVKYRRRRATWTAKRPAKYSRRRTRKYSRRRNPGMSYKRRRYTRRRNPNMPRMLRFLNQRFLTRAAGIGGGVAAGYIAMPLWVQIMPETFTGNYRRFYGLLNVLLGGLIATNTKRGIGRDIGATLAGTGVYDLIVKFLPDLGLPALPNSSPMIEGFMPEKDTTPAIPDVPADETVEANYNPALMGANYNRNSLSANFRPQAYARTRLSANYDVDALFGGNGTPDGGM